MAEPGLLASLREKPSCFATNDHTIADWINRQLQLWYELEKVCQPIHVTTMPIEPAWLKHWFSVFHRVCLCLYIMLIPNSELHNTTFRHKLEATNCCFKNQSKRPDNVSHKTNSKAKLYSHPFTIIYNTTSYKNLWLRCILTETNSKFENR